METDRIHILHTLEKQGLLDAAQSAELLQLISNKPENRKVYDELERIWEAAGQLPQPDTDKAWQQLRSKIESQQMARIIALPLYQRTWFRYGIAASMVFMVLGFLIYPMLKGNTQVTYTALAGEVSQLDLPDGTHVFLNQNSSLTYTDKGDIREVRFEGEAYFKVARNPEKPFLIQGPKTTTSVLGTAFHLLDRKANAEAFLHVNEGKVRFASGKEELIVMGGEKAQLSQQKLSRSNLTATFEPEMWEKGQLIFKDQTLAEVFAQLEVKYGTRFYTNNPKLLNCRFTGNFGSESRDEAAQILAKTMNLTVNAEESQVGFNGEGCADE